MEFKDKRVIVTGGTKGLGKAIGLTFAQEGAWVAVNYSTDDEAASKMEAELVSLSTEFLLLKGLYKSLIANVGDIIDVKVLIDGQEIESLGGHLPLLYPLRNLVSMNLT